MSKTILVIDDSSTIRRLADSTLSRAGYVVMLAANAQDGLRMAAESLPDMILLDHQLPGTTGFEVCQELLASDETRQLPVVISSTLRKRAYVEYAELPNVVDMLPKPYSEELLVTTTVNALDTGTLIVESQEQGTAVPEVIDELGESELSGTFSGFAVREVIDFLNNGRKAGVLEIDSGQNRYWMYLEDGRVQGITATGVPSTVITERLPDTLKELAPVLNMTVSGAEVDGLVDLLNTNVLDPRLLRRLLRHQAAVLLTSCFTGNLRTFRFDANRERPPLYQRLPLDVSVLALLVEGAQTIDEGEIPPSTEQTFFCRQPIRGQNLDRAGLSAQQAKILGRLTSPQTLRELANVLGWETSEVRRVLYGLELADLAAAIPEDSTRQVVLFEPDADAAERLNQALGSSRDYKFQVVSDDVAFGLILKRTSPEAVIVADPTTTAALRDEIDGDHSSTVWLAGSVTEDVPHDFDAVAHHPFTAPNLIAVLDRIFQEKTSDLAAVPPSSQAASKDATTADKSLETSPEDSESQYTATLEQLRSLMKSDIEEPTLCQ